MKMDDLGNPVQNIYIRKVERVGGKLQNTVIHTYPKPVRSSGRTTRRST